ncbi:hypothetical protein D3C71_1081850 [compost metagenome]
MKTDIHRTVNRSRTTHEQGRDWSGADHRCLMRHCNWLTITSATIVVDDANGVSWLVVHQPVEVFTLVAAKEGTEFTTIQPVIESRQRQEFGLTRGRVEHGYLCRCSTDIGIVQRYEDRVPSFEGSIGVDDASGVGRVRYFWNIEFRHARNESCNHWERGGDLQEFVAVPRDDVRLSLSNLNVALFNLGAAR